MNVSILATHVSILAMYVSFCHSKGDGHCYRIPKWMQTCHHGASDKSATLYCSPWPQHTSLSAHPATRRSLSAQR